MWFHKFLQAPSFSRFTLFPFPVNLELQCSKICQTVASINCHKSISRVFFQIYFWRFFAIWPIFAAAESTRRRLCSTAPRSPCTAQVNEWSSVKCPTIIKRKNKNQCYTKTNKKKSAIMSKKPEKSSPQNTWKWAFLVHCREPPAMMLFFSVWTLNCGCWKIWNDVWQLELKVS